MQTTCTQTHTLTSSRACWCCRERQNVCCCSCAMILSLSLTASLSHRCWVASCSTSVSLVSDCTQETGGGEGRGEEGEEGEEGEGEGRERKGETYIDIIHSSIKWLYIWFLLSSFYLWRKGHFRNHEAQIGQTPDIIWSSLMKFLSTRPVAYWLPG